MGARNFSCVEVYRILAESRSGPDSGFYDKITVENKQQISVSV
jgi:hypothetical protein